MQKPSYVSMTVFLLQEGHLNHLEINDIYSFLLLAQCKTERLSAEDLSQEFSMIFVTKISFSFELKDFVIIN